MWSQESGFVVGVRQRPWRGNLAAVGEPMPEGTMGAITFDNPSRSGKLWLYDPARGDLIIPFKYDEFALEAGSAQHMYNGKFNPVGNPTLFLHGGMVKFMVGGWEGSPPSVDPTLLRGYTGVFWR